MMERPQASSGYGGEDLHLNIIGEDIVVIGSSGASAQNELSHSQFAANIHISTL